MKNPMKRIPSRTLIALIVFTLITPFPSLAQNASTTTDTEERRAEMRVQAEQRREGIQNQNAERRENLDAERDTNRLERTLAFQERARNHTDLMIRRFLAAIERLEKLALRINSRIEKMKERGINTSVAKDHMDNAEAKIKEAKTEIDKMPAALEEAFKAETLRGAFVEVREIVNSAKTLIKEAHASMVRAIASMKAAAGDARDEETDSN